MPFDGNPTDFTTTNPIAKTLRDAAAYIERFGWCQGPIKDKYGSVCMGGAIMQSSGCKWEQGPAFEAASQYLKSHDLVPDDIPFPVVWYSEQSGHRTKEDVIAALNGTADAIEAGELT